MRAVLVLAMMAVSGGIATANFGEAEGFSGRHGADCSACHGPDPVAAPPRASLTVEGLPSSWQADTAYEITFRVAGGPDASPIPGRPHGGLNVEVESGTLTAPSGMEELLRFPQPNEASYTVAGTRVREWRVLWTAPALEQEPRPIHWWAAAISANGNHDPDGPGAGGETGDAPATWTAVVPPSDDALAAWAERPVARVELETTPASIAYDKQPLQVTGRAVGAGDRVEWRADAAAWQPTWGYPTFLLYVPAQTPGAHTLEFRAMIGERAGPVTSLDLFVSAPGQTLGDASDQGPPPFWALLLFALPFLVLLFIRRLAK